MSKLEVTFVENRGGNEVAYGFVEFNDNRRVGYTSTEGVDRDATGGWGDVTDLHVRLATDALKAHGYLK